MKFFKKKEIKKDYAIYPFVYDKTYNEYTAIIDTIEFQCEDCTNEIVEYAKALAKAYPTCLKTIIKHLLADSAFDYKQGIYKEQTEETLLQSLHEPTIMLTSSIDGSCSYCNHTLDSVHIIVVEFSGIFEKIYNVSVDG